ncbi:hypothetical protein NH44784_046801 [Achromobacter xylosoxidans NH44784-1996]|nr:hypothetical protein NH44784_046801 [Achromobacter xylosoxidans NH44784-1996]
MHGWRQPECGGAPLSALVTSGHAACLLVHAVSLILDMRRCERRLSIWVPGRARSRHARTRGKWPRHRQ